MRRLLKARWLTILFICLSWWIIPLVYAGSQQTSSTTASTLITTARYIINEESAGRWTNAELLDYLNDGILDIATRTLCLENTEDVTLATATREYSLSSIDYIDVEAAMYDDGTDPAEALTRIRPRDAAHRVMSSVDQPTGFYIWNDKIGVDPEPTSTVNGHTVTVYYYERPSTITLSGTNPLPAHYDSLLVEYVVYRALEADGKYAKAALHWTIYTTGLDRYRVDFNTPTKEEEPQ